MDQLVERDAMMVFTIDAGAPVNVGSVGGLTRRYIPLLGGTVEGEYSGSVVPGGADWQTVAPNGILELQARYVLQLSRGAVEIQSNGIRSGSPAVLERLAAGEIVPPHEYYFRTAIRFFTASPELQHLNQMLGIAVGERFPNRVRISVHRVL
jgi:hypothetical protein